MEVHHHPHVERKSFKEYLLEGLMIFIAVTMGFIAENIREGIHESHRSGMYAASMIKDLEDDTAALRQFIAYYEYAARNTDTLMQLLGTADPKDVPSGKLYWYGLFGGSQRAFVPNDATFEQMKSSGTLSYLDKAVAIDVAKYNRLCRQMREYDDDYREVYTEVRISRSKLFNFYYNDIANGIFQDNLVRFDRARIDSFIQSKPPLLSTDKVLFNQYVEMIRSRRLGTLLIDARAVMQQATVLLRELKDTYGE